MSRLQIILNIFQKKDENWESKRWVEIDNDRFLCTFLHALFFSLIADFVRTPFCIIRGTWCSKKEVRDLSIVVGGQ